MNTEKLKQLGIPELEARAYLILLKFGNLDGRELAEKANILPTAVYRIVKSLIKKNLVVITKKEPMIFQAVKPEIALETFIQHKTEELKESKKEIMGELKALKVPRKKEKKYEITVFSGKLQSFKIGEELFNKAKKEILLISIGEKTPYSIKKASRNAIKRGVDFKFIVQKHDEENKKILKEFLSLGMNLRYYPIWGFHLVIIDKKEGFISVNNPDNTDERFTIRIISEGLAKALREYFYGIWKKAEVVKFS